MNRDNPLEKHLLSRCFSSQEKIDELLTTRYSKTGDQKPSLLLVPTGIDATKTKSVLNQERTDDPLKDIAKNRVRDTRVDLKVYLQNTIKNQKRLVKKIQAYNRTKTDKSKPFPLQRLLRHYSIPKFEDFVHLNYLWQKYIQNLIFPGDLVPNLPTLLPKLSSADFNGCLLTIIRAKNSNLVGIRGIVVWDAQHSFVLCVPRDGDSKEWNENESQFSPSENVGGLKVIPKSNCLFGFDVFVPGSEDECIGFTIIGSRFEFRSVDRSGRKFKNHNVDTII